MYEKITNVLHIVFFLLIGLGIGMACISSFLSTDNNTDYMEIQSEWRTPEPIDCVLADSEGGLMYVCYYEGSAVNVYDEKSGAFLWAVSVPSLRGSCFDLGGGTLSIYDTSEAYRYDSRTGVFLEKGESDTYGLPFDPEEDMSAQGEPVPGEVYYDQYEVFRINPDGSRTTLVSAPWWADCFNAFIWWLVSFSGVFGKAVLFLMDKIRQSVRAKRAVLSDFPENVS
ncbi:MAG: hypothetical protein ACI4XE_07055 [Acutalibacteraceae bacterium]